MLSKIKNVVKWRLKEFLIAKKRILSDFWLNTLGASVLCPRFLRRIIYILEGNRIGKGVSINPCVFMGPGNGKLYVGGGTFINYNCWFDLGDSIYIGKNCNIAMNVHFVNNTHEIGDCNRRAGKPLTKKIKVGNGVWIGADSIILPGVSIGDGTVIGAGSLVTKDCDCNSLYIGRPAKKYRNLT